MALIINGDMPKGCGWDCHYVAVNKYYDERDDKIHKCVFCALNHSIRYKDSGIPEEYEHTRHPNCPIIGEIPDKHGDLKDANIIMQWLNLKADNRVPVTVGEIIDFIEKQPTVLEASE